MKSASKNSLANKKVLITCGPTWVPIDRVRIISNVSTGQLGQSIAKELEKNKAKVTVLEGPVQNPLKATKDISVQKYSYFDELAQLLKHELKKDYDIVIHAAAVSDYKMVKSGNKKLGSKLRKLKLTLAPTQKIINCIKVLKPKAFLVGFKLDPEIAQKTIKKRTTYLFKEANCDLVVANKLNGNRYKAWLVNKSCGILAQASSRKSLSTNLIKQLKV